MMYSDRAHWSDLSPPPSPLSFAAIWDPSAGMITFSRQSVLESDTREEEKSHSFGVVELGDLVSEDSASVYSGETREARAVNRRTARLLTVGRRISRRIMSAASFPFDSRIFHSHSRKEGSYVSKKKHDDDSGFFEEASSLTATTRTFGTAPLLVNLNLKSVFSMSSTSTTDYVHVFPPSIFDNLASPTPVTAVSVPKIKIDLADSPHDSPLRTPSTLPQEMFAESSLHSWSRLSRPHPSTYQGTEASSTACSHHTSESSRARRMPSSVVPADPQEVLAREEYNYAISDSGYSTYEDSDTSEEKNTKPCTKIKELVSRLTCCGRTAEYDQEYEFEEDPGAREDEGWCWLFRGRTGSVLEL